jgi:tetratricopeptide (TPR) repeat protein
VRRLVPKSALVSYLVGREALGLNMPQQTVAAFTEEAPEGFFDVHTISGSWRFTYLTQAYHMLSNYERELEVADRAIRALPDMLTVRGSKVRALAALGRVDEINRTIDESLEISSRSGSRSGLMVQAADELRAHGHPQAALQVATRAVDWLRSRPPAERAKESYRPALANALYSAERWDEARAIFQELSAEHPIAAGYKGPPEAQTSRDHVSESLRISRAIDYLGALGTLAARRGDRREALRISDELARIDRPFLYGRHTYWRANIAALLGEKEQAIDLLRESFAEGNSYDVHLHRDMDFEPLWDYPPFIELLKPKG